MPSQSFDQSTKSPLPQRKERLGVGAAPQPVLSDVVSSCQFAFAAIEARGVRISPVSASFTDQVTSSGHSPLASTETVTHLVAVLSTHISMSSASPTSSVYCDSSETSEVSVVVTDSMLPLHPSPHESRSWIRNSVFAAPVQPRVAHAPAFRALTCATHSADTPPTV